MGIDHGGLDALVTQELLDRPDVISVFEEMGGETVSQRMHGGLFCNPGLAAFTERVGGPVDLVGHSRGGPVALATAHARPDLSWALTS